MKPFLFVTDLDNTLVGDDLAMAELNCQLEYHRQQYGTRIVYSTGRSLSLYQQLTTQRNLLQPDVLVVSVGTEIYYHGSNAPDPTWAEKLSEGWNRDRVVSTVAHFADLTPQPESEQRPFKVSYFVTQQAAREILPQLEELLRDRNLAIQLVYSGGIDLDILPRCANKGMAMTYLRQKLGFSPETTVACGDSGNDLSMFMDRNDRGIIVGNAMPELLHWHQANPYPHHYSASAPFAGGILEGLKYFGFL